MNKTIWKSLHRWRWSTRICHLYCNSYPPV